MKPSDQVRSCTLSASWTAARLVLAGVVFSSVLLSSVCELLKPIAKTTGTRSICMKLRRHADLHRCTGAALSSSHAAEKTLPWPGSVGVHNLCPKNVRASSAKAQVRCTSDMMNMTQAFHFVPNPDAIDFNRFPRQGLQEHGFSRRASSWVALGAPRDPRSMASSDISGSQSTLFWDFE